MASPTTHTENALSIDVVDEPGELRLVWRGKSQDREPGRFLMPLLLKALADSGANNQRLVLDFSSLEYMNSSSFAPVVKLLGEAARGAQRVELLYSQNRKWQALSFSALRAFETPDKRIALRAR